MAIDVKSLSKLVVEQMHGSASDGLLVEAVALRSERALAMRPVVRDLLLQAMLRRARISEQWLGAFWQWLESKQPDWLQNLRNWAGSKLPAFTKERSLQEQIEVVIAFFASVPDINRVDTTHLYDMIERGVNQAAFEAMHSDRFIENGSRVYVDDLIGAPDQEEINQSLEAELKALFGDNSSEDDYTSDHELSTESLDAALQDLEYKDQFLDELYQGTGQGSTPQGQ